MDSPCIWMSAGLVRYKLCDRDFDCERCPFDAALRGAPGWCEATPAGTEEPRRGPVPGGSLHRRLDFPDDRRYSAGHLWVSERGGVARAGVDALAAALLGAPSRVRDALTLELPYGAVSLASPVGGRAVRANPSLAARPQLVAEDPYGDGWLIEVEDPDVAGAPLVDGPVAFERAALDLRHFHRRAAMELLSDTASVGATMADGGQPLTDMRRMLGPRRYLALVREIVR